MAAFPKIFVYGFGPYEHYEAICGFLAGKSMNQFSSQRTLVSALCLVTLVFVFFLGGVHLSSAQVQDSEPAPIRIGWLGPMTGNTAKYAAYQSAILAEEAINERGGINGRPLKLLFQDGKCQSADAVRSANYLINVEKVHFIVGGHCTSETFPLSTIAERSKVVTMAAITSSPKLSDAGRYVFRITAVNTRGVDLMLPWVLQQEKVTHFAVLYEETDYAQGLGEYFAIAAQARGAAVPIVEGYAPGETDFRTVLIRIRHKQPHALYISVQSPDSMALIRQQMQDIGFNPLVLGNEVAGNAAKVLGDRSALFEGMVFSEPKWDLESPETKSFVERYKTRFNVPALPYGFWTAEAYDAVQLMADTIAKCGDDPDKVRDCLQQVRDYNGVSGKISIDEHHDGVRTYSLKAVRNGTVRELLSE